MSRNTRSTSLFVLTAACLVGCEGPEGLADGDGEGDEPFGPGLGQAVAGTDLATDVDEIQSSILVTNSLTPDDIVLNGVTVSRVLRNSLHASNLTFNTTPGSASGSNAATFKNWFLNADSGDKAFHDRIMKVIVACAVASGSSVKFADSSGSWTWTGKSNLAGSDWQSTVPTQDELERISACFYAHAKTSSGSVQVSVRSNLAGSSTLEREVQSTFDGAYFGDMTTNARYLCKSSNNLFGFAAAAAPPPYYTTTLLSDWGRGCYYSSTSCGGIFTVVDCEAVCTKQAFNTATRKNYVVGPTCTVGGRTYDVVNAFLPKIKTANGKKEGTTTSHFTLNDAAMKVTCTKCADGYALKFASSGKTATVGGWSTVAGGVTLMLRYAATTTTYLQIQINGTTLMNGTSPNWSFTSTGSTSTWRWKSIGISSLPANATLKLLGPTSGTAPLVDVVAMRD